MSAWLVENYQLAPSEIAQVLGTAAEYRVTEVADRNAGIVLRPARDRLRGIASHRASARLRPCPRANVYSS